MTIESFFENIESKFEDEDQVEAELTAVAFRKNGKVVELRIFNEKYDDILVISRDGSTEAINIDEYKEG